MLEAGDYAVYVGSDVRAAQKQGAVTVPELRVLSQLEEVCAPVVPFERMVNKDGQVAYEPVPPGHPLLEGPHCGEYAPGDSPSPGDKGIKLQDVADGLASMEDFVAQLTLEDLEALSHGD